MTSLDHELQQRLSALREQGLHRELRRIDSAQGTQILIDGAVLCNFSSNDYLGLANHPALKEAAQNAVAKFGAGAGASRLVCGSLAPHHQLEETLARFKGTEAALAFSTGYAAATGAICAVAGKEDVIVVDKLVHACIVDAARLSGAKLRVFDHNDLNDLEKILKWAAARPRTTGAPSRALIVTESVFSMDGDIAPLREIVELKEKYGAWLMIDEAHATGLYGKKHCGLAEELQIADRIELQMGTLGKALGASGGYICGSRTLVEYLLNRARSFIFSTAPVPAAAAAATAAIELVQSAEGEQRCRTLRAQIESTAKALERLAPQFAPNLKAPVAKPVAPLSAIFPLLIGDERGAVSVATALRAKGIFVPAIRFPTVARGSARLRITLSASHSVGDVQTLVRALDEIINHQS